MEDDLNNSATWDQEAYKQNQSRVVEEKARWGGREEDLNNNEVPDPSKAAANQHQRSRERQVEGRNHFAQESFGCNICGLKNHLTNECNRRVNCEICGLNNHITYECRRLPQWNEGPELCAAQVENQSFFFIEERTDPKLSKEKATTAIFTVTGGQATAKQIEEEFKHVVDRKVWRWAARKISENKFAMRFPDAKLVQVYSNFTSLGMIEAEAQITVEPWTATVNAKRKLQLV
jgi:hypothetical protein